MRIVDILPPRFKPPDNLFGSGDWLAVLHQEYNFTFKSVVEEIAGTERVVFLFSIVEDIYGARLLSLPFSDYYELSDPPELVTNAILFVRNSFPNLPFTVKPRACLDRLLTEGFTVVRKAFCHRVLLEGSIADLWARTSYAFKKGVKKAERNDVRFHIDNSEKGVDHFYGLLLKLRREKFQILPQPKSFYHALFQNFVRSGNGDICFAYHKDRPVAAAFILKSGNALYDKMGVSDLEYLELRPNNLLLWHVMQRGHAAGCEFLDMGLTQIDKEGLVRFKESMGGVATPIVYYRYQPDGYDVCTEQRIKALLNQMTKLWIDTATSNEQLEKAADSLYRYFC